MNDEREPVAAPAPARPPSGPVIAPLPGTPASTTAAAPPIDTLGVGARKPAAPLGTAREELDERAADPRMARERVGEARRAYQRYLELEPKGSYAADLRAIMGRLPAKL